MRTLLFITCLLCFLPFLGCEEQVCYLDLVWDSNQEPDLAGYRVYYGTSSHEYINFMDVGNVTTYRLDNLLEDVRYYIAVTAYDMSGNESDFSEEVSGVGVMGWLANARFDSGIGAESSIPRTGSTLDLFNSWNS